MKASQNHNPEAKLLTSLEGKISDSGLRALISMRGLHFVSDKKNALLLRIESALENLNKNALTEAKAKSPIDAYEKLEAALKSINESVSAVNNAISDVKEKSRQTKEADYSVTWKQVETNLDKLKTAFRRLENLGAELLPENLYLRWKAEISQYEYLLLPLMTTYAESCRVELQMIKRFTQLELDEITQIMRKHIPEDFSAEESITYQKDYMSALNDFTKEFSEKKNLWDTFLDILAGDTHQSPTEHVMMERWIEGEKGSL